MNFVLNIQHGYRHQLKRCLSMKTMLELVETNTEVSRDHLVPELGLHLITPACKLWHVNHVHSPFTTEPFWGQALARYIFDNRGLFSEKKVLDIGCGSGACTIAAAGCGAKYAVANDIDPFSEAAVVLNSKHNSITSIIFTGKNLLCKENFDKTFDFILVGDMFYDEAFASLLLTWLSKKVRQKSRILIGDPGRHSLMNLKQQCEEQKLAVELVVTYKLKNLDHFGFSTTSVWELSARST